MLAPSRGAAQAVPQRKLLEPNAALDAEFTRVGAVRELADGRVLVSDIGEAKLFATDFSRQALTPVGGPGQGPNEYRAIAALIPLPNDSTLLADPRGGRWLLLHGADIVAVVPPDSPPLRSGARNPFGADGSGHVLATSAVRRLEEGAGTTVTNAADSLWILLIGRSTGSIDTLGKARTRPSRIVVTGRDRAQSVSVIVNPLSVGEQVVLFPDGWVAVARLDPYRVNWVSNDGRQIRGDPLPEARVRVDERVKRWVLEERARQTGQPSARPEGVPDDDWPATIPPFLSNALLPAPDGTLWIVRAATKPNVATLYDVVDRRGRVVYRVSLAQSERVVGFGDGAVYSVASDEDGIQRLRRHALPR